MNFINGVFKFGYGVRFEESYVLDFGLYRFFGEVEAVDRIREFVYFGFLFRICSFFVGCLSE